MSDLSRMTERLIGQPMFELLSLANGLEKAGQKIAHFEIGDPDFDSPSHSIEAVKKALDDNLTHYCDSMGLMEFREAVAAYLELKMKFKPAINQVLICPANAIIDFVIRCVVNPGEEVIHPDPGFPTYFSSINYNGVVSVPVQLTEKNKFRMQPDDIRDKITNKTKLIIINTPHNPTGAMMTEKEVVEIAQLAIDKDVFLLSDEVYSEIIYGVHHYSPSIVDRCRERVILLGSLSKNFSMSGWRLGYAVGPENLMTKVGLLLQTILSCLPVFTQIGGRAVLLGDQSFICDRVKELKERRNVLVRGLNSLPGVSCIEPEGSFYVFANIKKLSVTSEFYCKSILNKLGICLLPGNCFGHFGEGYVRLSYASTPVELIEASLQKMSDFHV